MCQHFHYLRDCTGCRWRLGSARPHVPSLHWKNSCAKKAQARNALFPLPPTGFASLFFATTGGGANDAAAQARCGFCGRLSICTECKVLQRSAVALHCVMERLRITQGRKVSGLLGLRVRKPAGDGVFVFGTVRTRCESVITQPNNKAAVRPSLCGFPQFCGIAQHRHHSPTVSNDLEGAKKLQKGRRIAIFHAWAGKRVILVSKGSKRAGAPVALDSHLLPQRVISGKRKGNILFKLLFYWVW